MSVRDVIEEKLKLALSPQHLEVHDESHMHKGHAGAPGGGESHFRVVAVSLEFEGKNRLARQRLIHKVLDEEIKGPIHALSLFLKTPDESPY